MYHSTTKLFKIFQKCTTGFLIVYSGVLLQHTSLHNGVQLLDWPAQSPDLNPIEHLWNEVDRRLKKLPVRISGKEDLWDKIQGIWNEIEVDVCTNLIESMPRRINDVIKAKGGYMK